MTGEASLGMSFLCVEWQFPENPIYEEQKLKNVTVLTNLSH
jgi:hypothetical protein